MCAPHWLTWTLESDKDAILLALRIEQADVVFVPEQVRSGAAKPVHPADVKVVTVDIPQLVVLLVAIHVRCS